MPRGGKRKGAGRSRGALSKLLASQAQQVNWTGQTPAEFLQAIMQDDQKPDAVRMEAAKIAAPYVHKKQPEAHEVTTNPYHGEEMILITRTTEA